MRMPKIISKAKKNNRLGLLGMQERVEMVGGIFTILSAPGKSTTVRVDIPSIDTVKPLSKTSNLHSNSSP